MTERRTKPRRDEDKLAYCPWYIRDFNSDGPVIAMSPLEEFCYRRLLDYQWLNGSIPLDVPTLARICKNIPTRQMAKVWGTLAPLFPDGVNRRQDHERRSALAAVKAASEHGKKGADARWNPIPEPSPPDAGGMPGHDPGQCYPEAEATTEIPTTTTHRARLVAALGESDDLASICRIARNPEALCAEINAHLTGMHSPQVTPEQMQRTLRDLAITGERVTGRMFRKFLGKTLEPETNGAKPAYTGYLT